MVKLRSFQLQSVAVPFRLSWGKLGYSRHLYITLEDEKGRRGQGEGILYKTTHLELLPYIEKKFTLDLNTLVTFEPALAFAVDTALLDLQGKIIKSLPQNPPVIREIFLLDSNLDKSVQFVRSHNTTAIKLKVGAGLEKDKKTIARVHDLTQGKYPLHLDANQAYSLLQALDLANFAKTKGVRLFEEPIKGDFSQVRIFRQSSGIPVMLDESVKSLQDLQLAIDQNCFDVLNVKLSRLGGITLSTSYVSKCRQNNKKIYLGCSEEQQIGTRAIFTFSRSLKNLYAIEGLGEERLANMPKLTYVPGRSSKIRFYFREFAGVWTTRLENVLHLSYSKLIS